MFRITLIVAIAVALVTFAMPAAPTRADSGAIGVPECGASRVAASGNLASAVPFIRGQLPPPPAITAKAAVVVDGDTGRVLYDLNANERRRPASTTKIMTAILAIEHGDLDRVVVSDVDATKMTTSSVMGLQPGVPITVRDLLYGLMLPSGNDAAVLLAESVDGSTPAFVDEMNQKASQLGLANTHYANPHGLDARDHYSSAYDLARLARYAMNNPQFAQVVGTQDWLLAPPSEYWLHNGNSFLQKYPGADGVKIGWTERAGWTLVASAVRDGHHLFVTVLDSQDRDADAAALMDWAFWTYDWVPTQNLAGAMRLAQRIGVGDALVRALSVCG